jgi:hypothetical protein
MGSYFPDSHLLGKQEGKKGCNALALVNYRLSKKAIHLAFLIENFQVTGSRTDSNGSSGSR